MHYPSRHLFVKIVSLLIGLALVNIATAQDIDRKKVNITYIALPLVNLPEKTETYAVIVKPRETIWGSSLGNAYDAQKIFINGYYRLDMITDADLVIEVETINEAVFDQVYLDSYELTYKKDKNSPEIKYTVFYYKVSYYSPKIVYRAFTKKGPVIFQGIFGGEKTSTDYGGSTQYGSHFSNEYSLSNAWANAKRGQMANQEKYHFDNAIKSIAGVAFAHGMHIRTINFTVKYVDEKKGKTVYEDLREAMDYYEQAVATVITDKIGLINKLIQPDFEKRKELMAKAIAIWEKALSEADYENKKSRIDAKVARHLYFNLALASMVIEDYTKAKEYAQGRKKDVGSWDKNFLSGIRDLSKEIDYRVAMQEANKWRQLMLTDSNEWVYKDPATRKREADELLALRQKAISDSIANLNAKAPAKKQPAKKAVKPIVKKAGLVKAKS